MHASHKLNMDGHRQSVVTCSMCKLVYKAAFGGTIQHISKICSLNKLRLHGF